MKLVFPARVSAPWVLTALWTFCGVAIYLIAPKIAPGILLLSVVAPLAWWQGRARDALLWQPSQITLVLLIAGVYLLINASWSLVPGQAYLSVATFFLAILTLHFAMNALHRIDPPILTAMALGLYAGFVASALVLSLEIIADHPIHQRIFQAFPALSSGVDRTVETGAAGSLPSYFLNRSMAALVFLLWPTLLSVHRLGTSTRSRAILLAALIPGGTAILASDHATSQIAALGGFGAFFLHRLAPRVAWRLTVLGWVVACVAVVPMGLVAYSLHLHQASWLPFSAQHRIVIWGVTSQLVTNAPLFGSGVASARGLAHIDGDQPGYAPGTQFPLSTTLHSHNAYLQVWFETGLAGAVLLLGIGLLVLQSIARAEARLRPALLAAFTSCALLAASSFSIWAPWFLASFALAAIFAVPACTLVHGRREGGS